MDDEPQTTIIETLILKAIEIKTDYPKLISITRLLYETLDDKTKKKHPQIKKILQEYDKNQELRRITHLLTTIHQDTEASYEYLQNQNRDPQLTYQTQTEKTIHTNTNHIIKFYAKLLQTLSDEGITP